MPTAPTSPDITRPADAQRVLSEHRLTLGGGAGSRRRLGVVAPAPRPTAVHDDLADASA